MVNIDKVLDEMMANSDMSFGEFKQMLAQSAERAYKEKQAREEKKKRSEWATEVSKRLCDIANRALTDSLTADDVAYIQQLYIHSKYPNAPHSVLDEMLDGKNIDYIIKITIKAAEDFTPMLEMMGTTWDHVMKNTTREDKDKAMDEAVKEINEVSKHDKDKSDDIIITKFLQSNSWRKKF